MSGAAVPPANANNSVSGNEGSAVERRCDNADCNAAKLLSLVPKRKTAQFITDPNVMERPMLINGFTTVFQVDGSGAKLSDLKNVPNSGAQTPKTIYRIVPNTHAHIVNYVVVDAEGESLRKINDSDPATMRKLLESQKVSADQMLKKLIAGVNVGIAPTSSANNRTAGPQSSPAANSSTPITAPVSVTKQSPVAAPNAVAAAAAAPLSTSGVVSTAQIQLPIRMHPNLKITAVAGAESVPGTPTVATAAPPTVPLITPVPLASLQSAPQRPPHPVPVIPPVVDTVDKPVFDKMQAELQELRRTVALLAEAQAKSHQQQPSPVPSTTNSGPSSTMRVKRLRQS